MVISGTHLQQVGSQCLGEQAQAVGCGQSDAVYAFAHFAIAGEFSVAFENEQRCVVEAYQGAYAALPAVGCVGIFAASAVFRVDDQEGNIRPEYLRTAAVERRLHDAIERLSVVTDAESLHATVGLPQGVMGRKFSVERRIFLDEYPVGIEVQEIGAVLVAHPKGAVGRHCKPFGIDAIAFGRDDFAAVRRIGFLSGDALSGGAGQAAEECTVIFTEHDFANEAQGVALPFKHADVRRIVGQWEYLAVDRGSVDIGPAVGQ